MADGEKSKEPFALSELRVSLGHDVRAHAAECGLNVAEIVAECTRDPKEKGVALTVTAACVEERIRAGCAILITHGTTFVGCAFLPELTPGSRELSTVLVRLAYRKHLVAKRVLYPAILQLHAQLGGETYATTKYGWIVEFGLDFGIRPISGLSLTPDVRAPLCTDAPCYLPGPGGACRKERTWHPGITDWNSATDCSVRKFMA